MKIVLQRVRRAAVQVDDECVGRIGPGLLLLVGFGPDDSEATLDWMVDKVLGLRVFADEAGRMNLPLDEVGGDVLAVSQFTLYGDVRKGRRPSFVGAAEPKDAARLYEGFVQRLRAKAPGRVETGRFGALMQVESVNDGPVTLLLEHG